MNKTNQILSSLTLVSLLVCLYLFIGSWALNAKADADCMKYSVPNAQVVGLKTYCGGVLQGTEIYISLSDLKNKYGDK